MVDEFGAEERFGGELLDFLCVLRVIAESARAGLGETGGREERQREDNAERAAHHGTPQGNKAAGDYTGCSPRRHNPIIAEVDDAGPFGL
jgi:hypothetical protein